MTGLREQGSGPDSAWVLAENPGGHAALVLDDGGFDGVDELAAQLRGEAHEEGFVDAVTLGAVGREEAAAFDGMVSHADSRGQAAEEEAAGLEHAPKAVQHGEEVGIVAGEVEDGVAEDDVEGGVGEGDRLYEFVAQIFDGEVGDEGGCEGAGLRDRFRVFVYAEDFVTVAEEIDEVAAGATACVEDSHAGDDVSTEELVEEVDVDGAELVFKVEHEGQ
jgi:hypothetical protein